ncbi:fucosyltransferase, partial [Helicobacter pylori]
MLQLKKKLPLNLP